MSNKSARKINLPKTTAVPRALEEIQKDFQQASFELGQVEYQIFVAKIQAEDLKNKILNLNQEGAARKELDSKEQK